MADRNFKALFLKPVRQDIRKSYFIFHHQKFHDSAPVPFFLYFSTGF